jgi:hypothetical protein
LPRARAALPFAPADRLPVSFDHSSRTRPATLSTKPSALSRDPDFTAGSFRVVLGNSAALVPGDWPRIRIGRESISRGRRGQARNMTSRESEDEDRELKRESERYRKAALEALGQLEWCIEYLYDQRKAEIARTLSRNRTRIIQRAGL